VFEPRAGRTLSIRQVRLGYKRAGNKQSAKR